MSLTIRSLFLAVCLGVSLTAACGGGPDPTKVADIKPGVMPPGESWTGVYFHPVYGYMHMVEQQGNVIGKWKRTDQSAWGTMSGRRIGNVLHFTWTEHKYGLVGPSSMSNGKGVFVFKAGKNGGAPELDGQFGLNDSEVGSDWHCVKQLHQLPELDTINGDTPGGAIQPGTLD